MSTFGGICAFCHTSRDEKNIIIGCSKIVLFKSDDGGKEVIGNVLKEEGEDFLLVYSFLDQIFSCDENEYVMNHNATKHDNASNVYRLVQLDPIRFKINLNGSSSVMFSSYYESIGVTNEELILPYNEVLSLLN